MYGDLRLEYTFVKLKAKDTLKVYLYIKCVLWGKTKFS